MNTEQLDAARTHLQNLEGRRSGNVKELSSTGRATHPSRSIAEKIYWSSSVQRPT